MSSQGLSVGIIGYGFSAKVFHIPFILANPRLHLHTIVQRRPTPASSSIVDHPNVVHRLSADDVFADPDVQVVIITTPPDTHLPYSLRALKAKKHVLVEKPFVPTAVQADLIAKTAKENGVLLCVFQNRRWDTDFLTAKSLIDSGKLGRIWAVETSFGRYSPTQPDSWRGTLGIEEGGGILYDLGTHLIDQAYVLFGLPDTVYGILSKQRGDEGEPDSLFAILKYTRKELVVIVKAEVLSVEDPQPRLWVRGTKGSYQKLGVDVQEEQLIRGVSPSHHTFAMEDNDLAGRLSLVESENSVRTGTHPSVKPLTYMKLFDEFVDAILEGDASKVPVKAEEARDALTILEAVKRSAAQGNVVDL